LHLPAPACCAFWFSGFHLHWICATCAFYLPFCTCVSCCLPRIFLVRHLSTAAATARFSACIYRLPAVLRFLRHWILLRFCSAVLQFSAFLPFLPAVCLLYCCGWFFLLDQFSLGSATPGFCRGFLVSVHIADNAPAAPLPAITLLRSLPHRACLPRRSPFWILNTVLQATTAVTVYLEFMGYLCVSVATTCVRLPLGAACWVRRSACHRYLPTACLHLDTTACTISTDRFSAFRSAPFCSLPACLPLHRFVYVSACCLCVCVSADSTHRPLPPHRYRCSFSAFYLPFLDFILHLPFTSRSFPPFYCRYLHLPAVPAFCSFLRLLLGLPGTVAAYILLPALPLPACIDSHRFYVLDFLLPFSCLDAWVSWVTSAVRFVLWNAFGPACRFYYTCLPLVR